MAAGRETIRWADKHNNRNISHGANTIGEVYAFAQQQILPFLATQVYSQCQFDVSTRLILQNCQENENCLPHYLVGNVAAHANQIAAAVKKFNEDTQPQLRAYDLGEIVAAVTFVTYPPTLHRDSTSNISDLVYQ